MSRMPQIVGSLLITAILLGVLVNISGMPSLQECSAVLSGISWWLLSFCIIGVVCALLLRGVRWWLFLKNDIQCSLKEYVISFGWYFVLMSFIPARAGEISRVIWAKNKGGSGSAAAGVIVSERLQDLVILLMALTAVIVFKPIFGKMRSTAYAWMIALTIGYLVVTIGGQRISRLLAGVTVQNDLIRKIKNYLVNFMGGAAKLGIFKVHVSTLLVSILLWSILSFGVYLYLLTIFPALPFSAAVLVLSMVNISGLIGVTPGNAGVYEMAGIMALRFYGADPKTALIAVTGLHIMVIITTLLYGFLCYLGTRHYFNRVNYLSSVNDAR